MNKTAFIFSGQGAQYIGMGRQIAEQYRSAMNVFEEASESLGFDVKKMVFDGDEETLKITENTQPTILTASIACLQPLVEKGLMPKVTAGLSLGEYSSHVLAKTMSFSDAVKIVKKRGKYMQEAVPLGVGGMAAIIGLENETVFKICEELSDIGVVEAVNLNCPGQIVIAGEIKALESAMERCKEAGAKRALLLPVSAPFHSSLLKPAGELLKKEFETIIINKPMIPVVTNITAEYITDENVAVELLVKQVSNPVLWEKSVINMIENGIETFVEIGPGKVLCGFIKKINENVKTLNVADIDSLNTTLDELGK